MRTVSYTRTTSFFENADIPTNTIAIQNEHIKSYALTHGWRIQGKYSDRKNSTDADGAFERLKQDGILRKFDIVIADSIYRVGKNLWDAKELLFQTFFYAGIEFAIVEDDFCSIGESDSEVEKYFKDKYDVYFREDSKHRINSRNMAGVLNWSDIKYGYYLTDDKQMKINEETAPIVQRIFKLYAEGKEMTEIAGMLKKDKIPAPAVEQGIKRKIDNPYNWTVNSIRTILKRTAYIGYWSKTVQDETIEFHNDPIITENLFRAVQKRLESKVKRNKNGYKPRHKFSGLLFDQYNGACIRSGQDELGRTYFKYDALIQKQKGLADQRLYIEDVESSVKDLLVKEKEKAFEILQLLRSDAGETKERMLNVLREEFRERAMEIADGEAERIDTHRKYNNKTISTAILEDVEYRRNERIRKTEDYFTQLEKRATYIQTLYSESNPWLNLYMNYNESDELDHTLLRKYVSKIEINNLKVVNVQMKENEWYMSFPKDWRER